MCAYNPANVIRQNAQIEKVFEIQPKTIFYHPREDSNNNLYVCSQMGEIIKFKEDGTYATLMSFSGQPTCVAFAEMEEGEILEGISKDKNSRLNSGLNGSKSNNTIEESKEYLIFSDLANSIIYFVKPNGQKEFLAKDFEGCPLKGPTSIALNSGQQCIFFCDGGYFESTSLSRPTGSVYYVTLSQDKLIQPILSNCLAYPADIYYDENLLVGYIAETFNNRILRFVESGEESGNYQTSVFYTFEGRVGPTAITCDDLGNIYVARFEYQNKVGDVNGLIDVINKDGNHIGSLVVPGMPEITGLYIPKNDSKENRSKMYLYFTEKNFSGVQRIKLGNFITDVDKALDKVY